MSGPRLDSKISTDSDEFRSRAAHHRALAEQLRGDVAKAALGGTEKSRERHVSRGKLLPRDRVEGRLLEHGEPLAPERGEVEQLAEDGPVERDPLGGALHLDEAAVTGHDDVHVGLGGGVLGVVEVEHRIPRDDADADGGDGVGQR